jgi:hypothetical protein
VDESTTPPHISTVGGGGAPSTMTSMQRLAFRQVTGDLVTRRPEMLLQASWTDPLHLTSPSWSTTPRQHVDWPRYHCRILLPISTTAGWFPAGLVGEAQMGLVQIGMHEKKRRREERIRTLKKQIRERTEKETGKGARERKYSKKYRFIKRVTLSFPFLSFL